MLKKILVCAFAFILAILLSGYLSLSLSARRPLSASELARFSSAILWNTMLHSGEDGGSRSLELARSALSSPLASGGIGIDGRLYSYPLPKYSIHRGGQCYLTFASFEELQDYCRRELPSGGWRHVEQMGAAHFFEGDGARMVITHHFYLGTSISEFQISVAER